MLEVRVPPACSEAERLHEMGRRFKNARRLKGLSVEEAAGRARVAGWLVRDFEGGSLQAADGLMLGEIERLAASIDIPLATLLRT